MNSVRLICISIIALFLISPAKSNLIPNSSFEMDTNGVPNGWNFWVRQGYESDVCFDIDYRYNTDGNKSLKITNAGNGDCACALNEEYDVSYKEKFIYHFRVAMKCKKVEGRATARVVSINSKGKRDWNFVNLVSFGNHNFRYLEQIFLIPSNVIKIRIDLILNGKGSVWFDDVSLIKEGMKNISRLTVGSKTFIETDRIDEKRNNTGFTKEEMKRGFVIFYRENIDKIFPYSIPTRNEITDSIYAFSTLGEYKPIAFTIYALKDLADVRISCSDLRSKGGVISKDAFDVKTVKCWPQRTSWNSYTYSIIPELLEKRNKVQIPKGKSQQFWLTIRVPKCAVAGDYISIIDITTRNTKPRQIKLFLKVLPFSLITPPKVWGLYADNKRWLKMTNSRIEEEVQKIKEYGINALLLSFPIRNIHVSENTVKINFSEFQRYIDIYQKLKFKGPIVLSLQGVDQTIKNVTKNNERKFNILFKKTIRAFVEEREKEKWPEIIFHVIDEPSFHLEKRKKAVRYLKLIKEVGGKTFTTTDAAFTQQSLDPWLDFRCYNLNFVAKSKEQNKLRRKEIRDSGDIFWWYGSGCYTDQENAHANRYLVGFLFWKTGAEGQWSWTFQRPKGDPYNDFDGEKFKEAKDACITYPSQSNVTFIPTMQWEAIREGINDAKYIYTLTTMVNRMENKRKKNLYQYRLKNIMEDIPWLPPEYPSYRELEELRKKVVDEILAIKEYLH